MATGAINPALLRNASFNPYEQQFYITMPDGTTMQPVVMSDVVAMQNIAVQTGIIYGIQVGMSAVLLAVLVMMTKPDKRRSIVFIFNAIAPIALFIRAVVSCVLLNGPLYNPFNWITNTYYNLGNARQLSILGEVLGFICIFAIEMSLFFQTQIVCCTLRARYRHPITASCVLVAFESIALRFVTMVFNCMYGIKKMNAAVPHAWELITTLSSAYNISVVFSIMFFSLVFCCKLGYAIHQRRKMGMTQFGPMQVIFVMGCQTLFVPAIFGILSYFVLTGVQLYSLMPMVVATFLPLSSIWASTNATSNLNIAAPNQWRARRMSTGARRKSKMMSEKQLLDTNNTADTLVDDQRNESFSGASPRKYGHQASADRDSIDLEMQKMGHRIHVDRTYEVRSD